MKEMDKAKQIMYRMLEQMPIVKIFIRVAKYEERFNRIEEARSLYETALKELGPDALDENLFLAFTDFEIRYKESERARVLFEYGIKNIPKEKCRRLRSKF